MLVLIKGAGDLASGVALRLHRAHMDVVMTDLERPSAIRRTVAFSEAIYCGSACVEGTTARLAPTLEDVRAIVAANEIAVIANASAALMHKLDADVLVDAVIAKRNTGSCITDAPIVIALGPGFTVGQDCHAAIETMRGHDLGRVYYSPGEAPLPNTGIPGPVGGRGAERVMHTPAAGRFCCIHQIGDIVNAGETVAEIGGMPVCAAFRGVLRGLLPDGFEAAKGFKCADVDPRCERSYCFTVSDKARAIGGAVLEAILHFSQGAKA